MRFWGVLLVTLVAAATSRGAEAPGGMTLHVIPQAHIDLAWWWRYAPETLEVVVGHTLETAFGNMETFPDYTFTYLQVPAIEPLETAEPALFYKLRYYAHRGDAMELRIPNPGAGGDGGRLAIGSGFWCEVDGCVPSGESLVRQCLYGKRYFQRVFGIDVKTAWFQDAWTHPWTLPQILKKSGMDSYMFTRPRGEGEQMFWWEGPDGSRVFAYKPFEEGGESLAAQEKIDARLREMNRRYGVRDDITLIGVGNHGGGAIRADVARMRQAMARRTEGGTTGGLPPKMEFSTPARFVESVLKEAHDFPVIRDELPPTIRGAYTSQAEIKRWNRVCENLLLTVEKFAAIAARLKLRDYPQEELYQAWKKVMLNQFHDTISGTDILPSIEDALGRYAAVEAWGRGELRECLEVISSRIDTRGPGVPIAVFNPMAWERSGMVEASIPCEFPSGTVRVVDDAGNPIDSQDVTRQPRDDGRLAFSFMAGDVPSLGYRIYWAKAEAKRGNAEASRKPAELTLENEYFLVRVSSATGCVERIFDKRNQREMLDASGRGNLIQILDDYGDSEGFLKSAEGKPEHNVWDGPCGDLLGVSSVAWLDHGPVCQAIEVKKQYELARFTQRIVLHPGLPYIEFELDVDWEGTNKMVKVGFPFSVSPGETSYEIPYGAIVRPSRGEESAAQTWVDLTAEDYGVSFLNDSRYGYDVRGNVARLSVLRCPAEPVAATEERGVHRLRYALYPHAGTWQQADTVRQAHAFNNPLIGVTVQSHEGALPPRYSFLKVTPGTVVANVLKKTEDSDDLILRCYESAGHLSEAHIELAPEITPSAVHQTDLLERGLKDIVPTGGKFDVEMGAFSIETFALIEH